MPFRASLRGSPLLILLAVGCAPQIPYRYTPGTPSTARGTIALAPHATVGELHAAIRSAFPGAASCPLWFDETANPGPASSPVRIVVVSGELRLPAYPECGESLLGELGVRDQIVLSTGGLSGGFRWCEHGESMPMSSKGIVPSLQHDIERQMIGYHGIAWAAWSTDDAHQTLAIIDRFRAAGVPLILVDEQKPEPRSSYGLHPCEPRWEEGID